MREEIVHSDLAGLAVPIDSLSPFPGNPNRGDVDLIAESIGANGLYRPVVFQKSTGHILAGNHTVQAARQRGLTEIPAVGLDVDDAAAARIVAADNRTAEAAVRDPELLLALLDGLDDLTGTGYSDEEFAALQRLLVPPDLDDLAASLPEPTASDNWVNVNVRVPRHVSAAWTAHAKTHASEAAAFAALLGIEDIPDADESPW